MTRRVPGPDGPERNRLSLLSRWKIFDNLRRSTVEIAQLALPRGRLDSAARLAARAGRCSACSRLAAPWIARRSSSRSLRPPLDKSWQAYYAAVGRDALTSAQQVALAITFLPHQALDIGRRHRAHALAALRLDGSLLEWQTASQAERLPPARARVAWQPMWPAVALGGAIARVRRERALAADVGARLLALVSGHVPLLALWVVSPAIAGALSAPPIAERDLAAAQRRDDALRYALLHWRSSIASSRRRRNWLAPDNFQEDPEPVVAMRTSPTNIGLQLLVTVTALRPRLHHRRRHDARLELAFRSLERMRRFRGHFFNWYDLHDLRVLEPAYVSTVDSGNLAGHLIALRQACLELRGSRRRTPACGAALGRVWLIATERLAAFAAAAPSGAPVLARAVPAARAAPRESRAAIAAQGCSAPRGSSRRWAAPSPTARRSRATPRR